MYVVRAFMAPGHVVVAWKPPKVTRFWKSRFKFAFGRKKKGKVFGILSQLKILSKSNDVHAQNNVLAVRNELVLPLKIRRAEGDDIKFIHYVTCIKMDFCSAWCLNNTWHWY
jgi:hypothetical protein